MRSGGIVVNLGLPVALTALLLLVTHAALLAPSGQRVIEETTGYGLRQGGCKLASYSLNPLAIYGSPLGMFLGGIYIQSSNSAEHMGMPMSNRAPFKTIPGQWLESLYRSMVQHEHLHASVELTREDLSPGRRIQMENANRLANQRLRFAYLLDPTNPQALQPLIYHTFKGETRADKQDIYDLITNTVGALRTSNGKWPEHSLQAGYAPGRAGPLITIRGAMPWSSCWPR